MQLRSRNLLDASTQSRRSKGEHGNSSSRGVQVKQEVTERLVPSLQAAPVAPVLVGPFRNRDYYYFCHACKIEMPSWKKIWKHLRKQHPALVAYRKPIKHVNQEPNVNHPRHFCKSCDHTFPKKEAFRRHLKNRHHMVLKPKGMPLAKQDDILPNLNDPNLHDPNFYCPPCGRYYKSKYYFWTHCRQRHGIERPQEIPLKAQLPDFHDPNFYCRVCDVTLNSLRKYRSHCHYQHQMSCQALNPDSKTLKGNHCDLCDRVLCNRRTFYSHLFLLHGVENEAAYLERIKLQPDVHDPDLYCCSCDMTLENQLLFDKHMQSIHSLQKKPLPKNKPKPDPDDPNNHCRVCDFTYKSKVVYRAHMRRTHHMAFKRTSLYDPNHFPDPKDPNAYCSVCKFRFVHTASYRNHCRNVHRMSFPKLSKVNVNPNATINVDHPKLYCARCNHYYRSRGSFTTHIRKHHGLLLACKEEAIVQTIPAEILVEDA